MTIKNFFKSSSRPIVNISRALYLLLSVIAGAAIAISTAGYAEPITWTQGASFGFFIGSLIIVLESWLKGYSLSAFTHATFGFLIGILCWLLLTFAVRATGIDHLLIKSAPEKGKLYIDAFFLMTMSIFGFLGTVLALRSHKDDFAFVIPYVRFKEDALTSQPMVIDISTLIDGRLIQLIKSGFISGRIIIPRIVLEELQIMSNSPSGSNRARGEKGLKNLEILESLSDQKVTIAESSALLKTDTLQSILIHTANESNARLITLSDSVAQVASLRKISCLNIKALSEALRPGLNTGAKVDVYLSKKGKEDHQAVGQLSDGALIVVNNASSYIGTTQKVIILSVLNMANGPMGFAELEKNYALK